YGLLRRADTVPAIIVEAAYITGPDEAELLGTDAFRNAEAAAIANGIVRYLHTDDAGRGYIDGFTLGGSARSFEMDEFEDPPVEWTSPALTIRRARITCPSDATPSCTRRTRRWRKGSRPTRSSSRARPSTRRRPA